MSKKTLLGVLFLIISTLTVMGAFHLKNYMMLSKEKTPDTVIDGNNFSSIFQPTQEFYDFRNNRVDTAKLAKSDIESVTVIHFWASWCAPCITEIPELLHFVNESTKNKEKSYIKYIVVSLDENQDDLTRFLKNFPKLNENPIIRIWDKDNYLSKKFSINKLPATIFWYKNGEVKLVHGVVDWKGIQL